MALRRRKCEICGKYASFEGGKTAGDRCSRHKLSDQKSFRVELRSRDGDRVQIAYWIERDTMDRLKQLSEATDYPIRTILEAAVRHYYSWLEQECGEHEMDYGDGRHILRSKIG